MGYIYRAAESGSPCAGAICDVASTTWRELGQGQCRNSDNTSPTHTDEGSMTWQACQQTASDIPGSVAWECNGGYPDSCACQVFTGEATGGYQLGGSAENKAAGSGVKCFVGAAGVDLATCCSGPPDDPDTA